MFADSGADCCGIQEDWATADFDTEIQTTTQTASIDTPGGIVESNKFVNLSFKRKHDNVTWSTRFYLLPDIPLKLLGGKNLLESFGFVFPNGIPNCFKHPEELELDLNLELEPTFKPLYNKNNSNKMYLVCKKSNNIEVNQSTSMTNRIFAGTKVLMDYSIKGNENLSYNYAKAKQQQHLINKSKLYNLHLDNSKTANNHNNNNQISQLPTTNKHIHTTQTTSKPTTPITTRTAPKSNGKNEIDLENVNIDKLIGKRKLIWPDFSYIRYTHSDRLYNEFMHLVKKYDDIFATHQYDRRDLAIPPVKLGLKPEAYQQRIAVRQPQLSPAKTRAAIAIAQEHLKNGFYKPNENSIHNVPYGMLVKRGPDGTPDRFKEFYDFRKLNEMVTVRSANIPTIPDVTQWMEKTPFMLLSKFDKKNWYYQFPLDERDQQFTKTTIDGKEYIHTALGYGHANGPALGQDMSDRIAIESIDDWNDMMAWIDDDIMKHLVDAEVPQLIGSVEKYFATCRKYHALLNPEKLFVFITGVEYVGFIFQTNGKEITKSYRAQLLSLEKPITQHDLQNVMGSVQFIAPFTPYLAIVLYWLNRLQQQLPVAKRAKAKKQKLQWDKQANDAWKMLKHLIKYAKMVYYVTKEGKLLLRGDACTIGMSNILYQLQQNGKGNLVCVFVVIIANNSQHI